MSVTAQMNERMNEYAGEGAGGGRGQAARRGDAGGRPSSRHWLVATALFLSHEVPATRRGGAREYMQGRGAQEGTETGRWHLERTPCSV